MAAPEAAQTLRDRLRHRAPRDFQLKQAWRAVIRASRLRKRQTGRVGRLMGQADVDRALQAVVAGGGEAEATLDQLKADLRALSREATEDARRIALVDRIDAAVAALVPAPVAGPVAVTVAGWADGVPEAARRRLVGRTLDAPVPPAEAALLRHRLDGLVVAGRPLRVTVDLPPGRTLPAVPRDARADRGRWGRGAPWLPHLDDEGRYSLTPAEVARAQAARLPPGAPVVDACCGCGGNAVAFAEAGHPVVAIEPDAGRRALAARNLADRGLADRVTLRAGVAEREGLAALSPVAVLFVDPPWGGPGAGPEAVWAWLSARPALLAAPRLMLKLPADFPAHRLPPRPEGWRLWPWVEAGPPGQPGHLRLLTVTAGLPAAGRATGSAPASEPP